MYLLNQFENPDNFLAHYKTTGPEIWEQTEGKITHLVVGVGTGGTICGTGKFLKEKNSNIKIWGIDTYGSVFKKYKETGIFDKNEIYPYLTEGFGEDILPKNVDFDSIDQFIKVTDKDGAIMARRLSKEEGLFVGWSSGSAVHGAMEYAREHMTEKDVMVILLPDHGTRYLNKVYNDQWMKDHGFLEERNFGTARDIIRSRNGQNSLVTIDSGEKIEKAIQLLNREGIDQIPVVDGSNYVGSVSTAGLLEKVMAAPDARQMPLREVMDKPLQFVALDSTLDVLSSMLGKNNKAILVRDEAEQVHIITQHDVLEALTR